MKIAKYKVRILFQIDVNFNDNYYDSLKEILLKNIKKTSFIYHSNQRKREREGRLILIILIKHQFINVNITIWFS